MEVSGALSMAFTNSEKKANYNTQNGYFESLSL